MDPTMYVPAHGAHEKRLVSDAADIIKITCIDTQTVTAFLGF